MWVVLSMAHPWVQWHIASGKEKRSIVLSYLYIKHHMAYIYFMAATLMGNIWLKAKSLHWKFIIFKNVWFLILFLQFGGSNNICINFLSGNFNIFILWAFCVFLKQVIYLFIVYWIFFHSTYIERWFRKIQSSKIRRNLFPDFDLTV